MIRKTTKQSLKQLSPTELFQKVGDICAIVNTITNARQLLEVSLAQLLDLFGAKRGSIFILKGNGKDLILKIAQGMAVSEQEILVKRLGEGVVGRVAADKKPIFVHDISQDDRFRNYKARTSYQTPSFICAPLLLKDKLIGVINITDKECGSRFSRNELQLLDFLASQVALNYRRVELYQKFRKIVKQSKNLKSELGKSSEETSHLKKQVILQEKLASIGKLAGGIAHEFNNPLDGVIRYTNLCLEHVREDEVVRGYLMEVKHGLNRMVNIVKSLLACSRNTVPTMQKIDSKHAVEQAIQSLEADIIHKNITLKKNLQEGLPQLTDLGLELVVTNLIRNAVDAIEGPGGKIEVTTFLEGGQLILKVKDSGCGIDGERVQEIFDPFYTTKDIQKGCGLGLTIVGEIVKSYNGEINVESVPGGGTSFTITIPEGSTHGQ